VIGIVVGWKLAVRQIDKRGIRRFVKDENGNVIDWVRDLLWWSVVTGMVVAKLFDSVFYSGDFSLRTGLSSTGGFIGAVIGSFAYFWRHPQYKHLRVLLADAIVIAMAVAWIFGRMGCFVVHDHKGEFSDFFLAIPFPEGQRHDLGFYEMLFTMGMASVLYTLNLRKRWGPGFFLGVTGLMYGPVRFFLDFLRLERTDARYAGFTPAQWGALAFTLFGLWMVVRSFTGSTKVEHLGPVFDGEPGESWEAASPGSKEGKLEEPGKASDSSGKAKGDGSSSKGRSKPKSKSKKKGKKKR
ncbi:MAG: prolipoprotein diacylglyceryl transferase, partial [Deltaproteobacteria bacterium]|nr:prolipoprotein diacylglyceryl transferase [Deltaproteobacteria bacterium]